MSIALSGYYGFGNTGDEALCQAISEELMRLGATPLVLSANPELTRNLLDQKISVAKRKPGMSLLMALLRCNALFSGGGSLLQDHTSARSLDYYLAVIGIAKMLGKRVVVFNQGIGPLSPAGEAKVARALRGVRCIVRDTASKEYLTRLGVSCKLGADPALLLAAPNNSVRDPNHVLISVRGGHEDVTKQLRLLAEELLDLGKHVTVMSFQPSVDTSELNAFKDLKVQTTETSSPTEALRLIASAGTVLGVRLHALILAAAVGTPFVGINYDPKILAFCNDAGAQHLPMQFTNTQAIQALQHTPDWTAIEKMRTRARESFTWALGEDVDGL